MVTAGHHPSTAKPSASKNASPPPTVATCFAAGGDAIGLLPAEVGAQSGHTVLSFEVTDIEAEISDLEGRGVAFADYDTPDPKTVGHIADMGRERAAWFADSEGNILCVHQHT